MKIQSPVSSSLAADGHVGGLQYDVLQLHTRERSSSRSLGRFGENLDILGDLTSTDNRHDFALVYVAEEIRREIISFSSLHTVSRRILSGYLDQSAC